MSEFSSKLASVGRCREVTLLLCFWQTIECDGVPEFVSINMVVLGNTGDA